MNRSLVRILFFSLVVFGLAVQYQSQTKPLAAELSQQTSSSSGQDLSTWQTVSLAGKGIRFKAPADWRHYNFDMEVKDETFTIQEIEWNTPNKDLDNKDRIKIFTRIHNNGFAWFGHPASREEMVDNKLDNVTRTMPGKQSDTSYSEVKKVSLGGVEGVFHIMRFNSRDKNKGSRMAIMWTGYRTYHGKDQETDVTISSTLKAEALLRAIFSTLEVDQDNDTPKSKP